MAEETGQTPLRQLAEAFARLRAKEKGQPPGEALPFNVREHTTLTKFDHTPKDGEALEPLETVVISDDTYTVTVTGEDKE